MADYNFADVRTDTKGRLNLEFGKKVSLSDIIKTAKAEVPVTTDADEAWLSAENGELLNDLISKLVSAGHEKFYVSKTGEIFLTDDGEAQIIVTDFCLPTASLSRLKTMLETIDLNSEIDGDKLAVLVA
jgi:hypothetical protein